MEVESFPEFSDYLNRFGEGRSLYPFMLDGGTVLTPESCPRADRYTLIFGNGPPAFPGIPELRSEPVYRPDRRGGFPEPGGVRGHRQLSVYRKTAGRGRQNPSDLGRERESVQVAVLSDIHSNYRALEAVLAECEKRQIKDYLFLGDYVTDCAYPRKTMELLREAERQWNCKFIRETGKNICSGTGWPERMVGRKALQTERCSTPISSCWKRILYGWELWIFGGRSFMKGVLRCLCVTVLLGDPGQADAG